MYLDQKGKDFPQLSVTSPIWIQKTIEASLRFYGVEQVAFYIFDEDENIQHEIIEVIGTNLDISPWIHNQGSKMLGYFKHQTQQEIIESPQRCRVLSHDLSLYTGVADLCYGARAGFCLYSILPLTKTALMNIQQSWKLIQSWANSWVSHYQMLEHWEALYNKNHQDSQLTRTESDILELLVSGLNGPEIANLRSVSKETIKSQIKSILHKTQCRHQNELVSRFCFGHWVARPKLES
ncbi:helix-turn-helix transcriptional regulator [Vibrio ishigakensis]|nr:helix-turn-helix transcriptional regulator [Vibrio ishigakensis]